ncbi:AAA family ATPase [Vibrio splendidus]|uniref:ATP-dependent nuclease n=1 Tax=Vibrio crassostreae TaxID=246167 RepID=UPI000F496A9B|nr:AAA family ATPase [Vibrio crassostreae]ROR20691.1 putative ATP-dependent endonuclease of OLD family [Vibrio crassostreae]TCN98773.1 putative ATP-dependent endonuclease of OLD family [Vibrio crassostreae]CAK3350197.1 putative ATP-dependent endonuclease of the OLD family [Vibrio crassostreae]
MKLSSMKIRNFRTLDEEVSIDFAGGVTIVGPNSSGKTNILKAIEMFFTGYDNKYGYSVERDLPKKIETSQTTMTAWFEVEDSDEKISSLYSQLNGLVEEPRELTKYITVYLTLTKNGHASYGLFRGVKQIEDKKQEYNVLQRELVESILESFECHYVPSAKSIEGLYNELLLPFIKVHVSERLSEKVSEIESSLGEVSSYIDSQLEAANLNGLRSKFKLPNNSIEQLLSSFEYHISDPVETEIQRKGMGVQSAAILASLTWITSKEHLLNKSSVWLIEEPESYLHPELANSCNLILNSLNKKSHLITTTHSLTFVPQDPVRIIGTEIENGYTKCKQFPSYRLATESIRNSLGVRLSDFFNLGTLNIFVEGKTDRELFTWVLEKIAPLDSGRYKWEYVRSSDFLDFGGTGAIESFMKATYQHVHDERPIVVVLDGDQAGDNTRKNLQNFLRNKKIPFESNKQFVMLGQGLTVEGLFPQRWISDAHDLNPKWLKNFGHDMNGALLPFTYNGEDNKRKLRDYLMDRAGNETNIKWASNFIKLFDHIDKALEQQSQRMN